MGRPLCLPQLILQMSSPCNWENKMSRGHHHPPSRVQDMGRGRDAGDPLRSSPSFPAGTDICFISHGLAVNKSVAPVTLRTNPMTGRPLGATRRPLTL